MAKHANSQSSNISLGWLWLPTSDARPSSIPQHHHRTFAHRVHLNPVVIVEAERFVQEVALGRGLDVRRQSELIGEIAAPLQHHVACRSAPVVRMGKADVKIYKSDHNMLV